MVTTTDPISSVGKKTSAQELINRARELRPFVEQQTAETERLTHIS